jgi:hypothetical protein
MIPPSAKKQPWRSMLLLPAGLAAIMTPAILLAAGGNNQAGVWTSGGGFNAVVHGIEDRYHVHANRIPFMGLMSGIAGLYTRGGVRGLHVAEIENIQGPVDGQELNALVEQRVGQGWQRMVRETSRDSNDQSLIYIRPEGEHIGMLIVDLAGHEMDVVQLSVNPDRLSDEIEEHHHGKSHGQDHDKAAPDGDQPDQPEGSE